MKRRDEKAQSQIITVVLIVLVALVIIAIVWGVIQNAIKQSSEEIEVDILSVDLKVKLGSVFIDETNSNQLFFDITRGTDKAELKHLRVFLIDEDGVQSEVYIVNDFPKQLETKTVLLDISDFSGTIAEILVYPVSKSGKIGREEKYEVPEVGISTGTPPDSPPNVISPEDGGDDGCGDGEVEYGEGCAIDVNALESTSYNLDVEGATYVLTDDISVGNNGITIAAEGITLDGAGYSLTGAGFGWGVIADNQDSLTVKNFGNIGKFGREVYFNSVSNSVIEDNTMNSEMSPDSNYAIYLKNGGSNRVENNNIDLSTSSGDSFGVYLGVDTGNTFGDNEIIGNNIKVFGSSSSSSGIYLSASGTSNSNIIQDNTIESSTYGVRLFASGTSNSNIIQDNTIESSTYGIFLYTSGTSNSNIVQDNTISSSQYGIYLFGYGTLDSNTIQDNTMSSYSEYGVRLVTGYGGVLSNLLAIGNSACQEGLNGLSCSGGEISFDESSTGNIFEGVSCSEMNPSYYSSCP